MKSKERGIKKVISGQLFSRVRALPHLYKLFFKLYAEVTLYSL